MEGGEEKAQKQEHMDEEECDQRNAARGRRADGVHDDLAPRRTGDAPQGGAHRWKLHVEPLLNAERGPLFACPGMPEILTRQ